MPLLEKKASIFGIARFTRMRVGVGKAESEDVWKGEEEALKNIKSGKTEMEKQSTDEFLKELKELENA